MKRYLVLYVSSVSAKEQMSNATPEQGKQMMKVWTEWMEKNGKSLLDKGAPCLAVGSANPKVGGYSIFQADSEASLQAVLKNHPHQHAPGAHFDVHELLAM